MADIVITTDFSQVNALNNTLKSTDSLFTKVVDSLLREETRARRITKALAKTTEENLALIEKAEAIVAEKVQVAAQKREKARQREAERAEREAKRIAAAAEKAAKAEAKLAQEIASNQAKAAQQSTANLNQRLGVTGSSAMNSGAGFGALEQEIERLRQKYDRIYASSQLYETSLEELNRAHMLGITSIKQHEAAVESLNAEYQAFQSGVAQAGNRFAQHVNQTSDGLNKFGVAAQQTGYQVSDFIVQVQSGTNPLVAFSQQATQLAGLLYLLPPSMQAARIGMAGFSISMATATAGLTILIPLLAMIAMNFIGSGKESEEASKKIDKQAQAYDNLIAKVEELRLARQMEASGAQSQDEQISLNEVNSLLKERADLQRQILFASSQEQIVASQGRSTLSAENLKAEQADKQARLDKLNSVLDALVAERTETERLNRLNQIRTNQILDGLARQKKAAEEVLSKASETLGVMENMAKVKLSSIFTNAMPAAQTFLDKLREIAGAYAEYGPSGVIPGTAIPRGKFTEDGMTAAARGVMNDKPSPFGVVAGGAGGYAQDTSKGGSGGGSKTNSIDSLINQLQTERETIQEWYTESQDLLKSASESELQIIGGYNEAKLRLEKEYQDRLKGIRDEGNATALGDAATFFGGMAAVAQAGGDRTVKAMRIFSAAQALINSYVAFTEVLKDPSFIGRPFARFGAAASALSSGLAAVAAIKGGGSGGGSMSRGSATVAASSGSAPAPQTVFIDSISPESLYSGETLINLFEAFYDENDKRGKVFMVAR